MKFEDVENSRKAYITKLRQARKVFLCIALPIIITIIVVVSLLSGPILTPFVVVPVLSSVFIPFLFIFIIVSLITGFKTKKERTDYYRMYKSYFVSQQLAKFFTDLQYNHEQGLDSSILAATGMIHTGDRYYSNDLTHGKYKNIGFVQADVTVQDEHTDSDGDTTYITVFKGRYMIFEFPKKFDFKMVITPKGHFNSAMSRDNRKFEKIEVESVEFNKRFRVYAQDGFEAFYILDPASIISIEELEDKYNNRVSLYFYENKLFIGINNGNDSFEPPAPNRPINEQVELAKVNNDIQVIIDFVDKLRLDRKK